MYATKFFLTIILMLVNKGILTIKLLYKTFFDIFNSFREFFEYVYVAV